MATVISVCSSEKRQTRKTPQESVIIREGHGIVGDAHSGPGPRQISLLSSSSIAEMESAGISTSPGCCGENIDAGGFCDPTSLIPGTRFRLGESAILRITEIGKDNTDGHADSVISGNIFPEEGIFAEVLTGGKVYPGDELSILRDRGLTAGVLTVSDRAFRGEYLDESGPAVISALVEHGYVPVRYSTVPDEKSILASRLESWCDDGFVDVLFTTGGTGLSVRDITPEATMETCHRIVPGIPEMIRLESSGVTRTAWLSRAVAGIRERTLVINLPGSVRASRECVEFSIPVLKHALEILRGDISHCGHN